MAEYKKTIGTDNSVKQFGIIQEPTNNKSGVADVLYKNVYSVFDIGTMRMPEGCEIDNSTILAMAAQNFENFENQGIKTHYLGVIDNDGNE